jgi:putative ABC transport system permease protein
MMKVMRLAANRLRALVGRGRIVDEIGEELRQHELLLAERLVAEGMPADEAARAAKRRVGNTVALRDAGYDVRGGGLVETCLQDVRYGVRILGRTPIFTLTAFLTLALGIGANTAIFSVARGVLLRPLPYPHPDRLVMVWMDNRRIDLREDWHSYPAYADFRDQGVALDGLAIFNNQARTLTGDGEPERVIGAHSSANLFDVLGVQPILGRAYTPEEDRPGVNTVVVLSHDLWRRRYGSRQDIIGQSIPMNGQQLKVIGVMPAGFAFPNADTAFWTPTGASDAARANRGGLWLQIVGRLKSGVPLARAQADLDRVNTHILEQFPSQKGYGVFVEDYRDHLVGRTRPAILVLLGAVAFVLLIACANVANLLMARASVRERELALRSAIGAGRGRIVRQLLTESILLGVAGGAGGSVVAWLGLRALLAAAPPDLPRLDAIAIDGWVLAFTALLALGTGLLFGLAPALQAARTDPGHTLKEGGRGASAAGRSVRRALVVFEVALAVVLLVGAGLMLRSFDRMQRLDLGFRADHVLAARVSVWGEKYRQPGTTAEFFRQLTDRTAALPGVAGAAAVGAIFLTSTPNSTNFSIEGRPDFAPDERVEVPVDSVTPGYFAVMGVRLLKGRFFDARDADGAPETVIINDTMARRFWPTEDPIGRRMKYGLISSRGPWMTIVGVISDTRRTGYDSPVRPETYVPHAQAPSVSMMVVVRTNGDPQSAVPLLRSVVQSLDAGIALQRPAPIERLLADMAAQRRLNTLLLTAFAILAALLAAVGIYGVIAYSVAQRTRELGVRVALGASSGRILRLVVSEGLWLAGGGLLLGLTASAVVSRTMKTMLYDVSATDPATFASIAAVAILTATAASVLPAIRAVRVDPVTALRAD